MGILRPATPGFIVTLVATILLAVVSFCVPYFKSVYFLKATVEAQGKTGAITFGTLGYCIEIGSTFNCSKPSVGYELDINSLVGNKLPVKIPQVAVKWLTYCLVLHIVALGLSAGSAVFGLLAHVRDFSMTCCSTCVSGFAAAVALLAFIFDIAIFFAAKSRINAVGSASLGNATWLTLAAWLLLFFSGCFFTIGRCCISRRPGGNKWGGPAKGVEDAENFQGEQLRLNAIKAENDRKAKQNKPEGGLPTFHSEYQPLTGQDETDAYRDPHTNSQPAFGGRQNPNGGYSGGGYVPGQAGNRTVDDYYTSPTREYPPATNAYSTQPQPNANSGYGPAAVAGAAAVGAAAGAGYAQYSGHQSPRRQQSNYAPSTYSTSTYAPNLTSSPPPQNQYLAPVPQGYGHTSGGSSYHTAQGSHEQQPTNYSNYDPYQAQQAYAEPNYTSSPPMPNASNYGGTNSYFPNVAPQSSTPPQPTPERSYTLGGHNYDQGPNPYTAASTPATATHESTYYTPTSDIAPTPITTGYQSRSGPTSPVKGQPHGGLMVRNESPQDAPPTYDAGTSIVQGNWGKS